MPYKDKAKQKAWYDEDYKKNPEKYHQREAVYAKRKRSVRGLGMVDRSLFDKQFLKQNGQCAICLKALAYAGRETHFDHDHKTGELRGVLCSNCNVGLGQFKDKIDHLEKAIAYLKDWR